MVYKRKVAVVVDSSSCLPKEFWEKWDIYVAPHELIIEGRSYRDCIDIEPAEFYEILRKNEKLPTTSAPKPAIFLEAFQNASSVAENVLCLTLSSKFSATYDSARLASQMAQQSLPQLHVMVMDTQTAAGAEGLIALEAARKALKGEGLEEIKQCVEELIPRVNLIVFLDTLYYLGRSGKVPKVAVWASSLLGIKPIAEMQLGEARVVEKPRTRSKATQRLLDIMKSRVEKRPVHVNVMHANVIEDAKELSQRVEKEFSSVELFISEFTPVMGTHIGPGLLGLAFYSE